MEQEYELEAANVGELNPWFVLGLIEGKLSTGQSLTAADYSYAVRTAKKRAAREKNTQ